MQIRQSWALTKYLPFWIILQLYLAGKFDTLNAEMCDIEALGKALRAGNQRFGCRSKVSVLSYGFDHCL